MSQVTNCPTCGAAYRITGLGSESLPKLKALQNADAQNKIEELKKSLDELQKMLRTERSTAKAKILSLEAELSNLRTIINPN
jgi:cytochrome c553